MLCVVISTSRIHSWVSTALSHKVQELDLSLPAESVYMFPNTLFSAESLSTLKLKTYSKLEVPSLIHFPNLKTLHLAVEFPDDRSAQQIFSGCPVLQELHLINCNWKRTKRVTIYIPTLRQFSIIEDACPDDYPFTDRFNTLLYCEILIYAENLQYIDCTSFLTVEVSLCNLSSIVKAEIWFDDMYEMQDICIPRALRIFDAICSVKSLILWDETVEFLSGEDNLEARLPIFHNLTHLEVRRPSFYNDASIVLTHFLHKCPKVESLHIPETFYMARKGWVLDIAPQYLRCFLKTAIDLMFWWGGGRLKVTIFCSKDLAVDLEKQKEINHQLQVIRKGKANVGVEFRERKRRFHNFG
ncbi:putative F-box/LRR-repeat protein At4g00320 [Pistacia vera]|uniref:putative F-box/LRR-repeat protein At4g00320 n=1 Tax=Pistacia vera TaxID=55513 RepID=UPI0012634E4F|nr:putative F-box/LRR-repeat protein At4g00320 [Pistacia vera]